MNNISDREKEVLGSDLEERGQIGREGGRIGGDGSDRRGGGKG